MGNRLNTLRKTTLWICGVVCICLLMSSLLNRLMWHWVAKPPPVPAGESISTEVPRVEGARMYLGRNWLEVHDGLPVLYLTGSPFEMGYANGFLTQEYIHRQEEAMIFMLYRAVPISWARSVLKVFVVFKNRHLGRFVPEEQQMEMLGVSLGCPDANHELGPLFNRILAFHAAQDISYMLMNNPLISGRCTAFCAWDRMSADGHMIAGRNFDWEAAPVFDKDRMVILCEPDRGIPFVSLAWAGMVGTVSGMNREGLFVSVNGAPSDLAKDMGTPTCLVARQVLQNARTIAEAREIIRSANVFVSALFVVASRNDGRCVVVEKTPALTSFRDAGTNSYVVCANHFLTRDLASSPVNLAFLDADTSQSRYDRANELLADASAHMDPVTAVKILRNRTVTGGKSAGNGNRGAINPLIATHSVVADLTDLIFWAASPPHQLGTFVAFDVRNFTTECSNRNIPADSILTSGEYQKYLWAAGFLSRGKESLRAGEYEQAADFARLAETLNPGFYANQWLLGETLLKKRDLANAYRALTNAMGRFPPVARERNIISDLSHTGEN